MMRRLTVVVVTAALVLGAASAMAQTQTGEIVGRVSDNTGAVLPGVTVTITSPALLQPQVAITSNTGSYQFTRIPIGSYNVRFELPGFKTFVREGVQITVGFNAEINATLDISTVEPCMAGPKRPQDRVPLGQMKSAFARALTIAQQADHRSIHRHP